MAYGKRTYRKRRYNKRNQSLAKKAYRLAKKAYKAPEIKYNAITGTITGPDTTGNVQELSLLAEGTTNNTRVGDKISPTSLRVRLKANINASATATQVRMMIFTWKIDAPAGTGDLITGDAITGFKSENDKYKSKILYDKVFQLNSVNRPEIFVSRKFKVPKYIAYQTGSSIANTNGLYILLISDEATNVPLLAYNSRLYYKDS